ncbi:helitron_like_N domain-containing protein [Trichonephila inaurata madagascariensis]|uniref:Helitron_like_N domain-containing protein n=1 Tax=Trichonephila inaurata madagascariensis TaxID=2747483 RepID=A0A8X7BW98_9ARAC|nr:helitron_like_N domain-containing protein [Trichonephila inaurata madagascariensis]
MAYRKTKDKKNYEGMSELDDDSTDIWKENWFDKYEKSSEDLEDISLGQFVSKYYKNNKGEYVKRNKLRVICYRNYDMATDFNEYKREMVTLPIPFRHEEADILESIKFIRLHDENVDPTLQKRKKFESNIDIERTLQICRELYI